VEQPLVGGQRVPQDILLGDKKAGMGCGVRNIAIHKLIAQISSTEGGKRGETAQSST